MSLHGDTGPAKETTATMNSVNETHPGAGALRLTDEIRGQADRIGRTVTLLETCGRHTSAIGRFGIRAALPGNIRLLSGPGCPVCVTPGRDVDTALVLAGRKNVIFLACSDMLAVPGSGGGSLRKLAGQGADVREASSPLDALETARENPRREVVYMGIGFEDAAAEAACLVRACTEHGIANLSVFSVYRSIRPTIGMLLGDPELAVDGVLCPGPVGAVVGPECYGGIPGQGRAAIIGYGIESILEGISAILGQIEDGRREVEDRYADPAGPGGPTVMKDLLEEVFTAVPAEWRGLGVVDDSGLVFRDGYASFNALARVDVPIMESSDIMGCMCGVILRGKASPVECPLFGHACNPAHPIGPCMVSREGACFTWYAYPCAGKRGTAS